MHGGRGVCQWCARSSPVETRQNPRPRTTTTTVTVNSNSSSSIIINIIIIDKNNDVDGRSLVLDGYKNPVSNNKNNNNKYISDIVINGSIRRAGTLARQRQRRRRRRQHCYRAVSSTLFRRGVGASRRFSRYAVAGYGG